MLSHCSSRSPRRFPSPPSLMNPRRWGRLEEEEDQDWCWGPQLSPCSPQDFPPSLSWRRMWTAPGSWQFWRSSSVTFSSLSWITSLTSCRWTLVVKVKNIWGSLNISRAWIFCAETFSYLRQKHSTWFLERTTGLRSKRGQCSRSLISNSFLRGQYGLTVLLLIWSPGLVAVLHMLAFYRSVIEVII